MPTIYSTESPTNIEIIKDIDLSTLYAWISIFFVLLSLVLIKYYRKYKSIKSNNNFQKIVPIESSIHQVIDNYKDRNLDSDIYDISSDSSSESDSSESDSSNNSYNISLTSSNSSNDIEQGSIKPFTSLNNKLSKVVPVELNNKEPFKNFDKEKMKKLKKKLEILKNLENKLVHASQLDNKDAQNIMKLTNLSESELLDAYLH